MMTRPSRGLAALAAAGLIALAGCSSEIPQPSPSTPPTVAEPVLTTDQIDRVFSRISSTLASADLARDPELLPGVVTGPAATIRAAQYTVAMKTGTNDGITAIPEVLQSAAITDNQTWPRSSLVVTEQPEDLQPPRLAVISQANARAKYELWGWVRLFPGAQLALTTPATVVEPGSELATRIDVALEHYVDVLNKGDDSEYAAEFGEDELRTAIEARRTELSASMEPVGGTFTYEFSEPDTADGRPLAWESADGTTIVVATFTGTETAKAPKGARINPDEVVDALLGDAKVRNRFVVQRQIVVAMVVPAIAETTSVSVVGAENVRVAASLK